MSERLQQLLAAVAGMPPQFAIQTPGLGPMTAAQIRRQVLLESVAGLDPWQAAAVAVGTLRAAGVDPAAIDPDLPPDTPDDHCLSVAVGILVELATEAEPAAETPPPAARQVEELPAPLILCHDPCDPDPE